MVEQYGPCGRQSDEIGVDGRHRALRVRRMPTAPLTSTAEPAHCDALVAHLTHRLPPTAAQILRRWSDAHDKVRDLRGYAAPRALCALGCSGGGGRGEDRSLGHGRSGWISWVACSRGEPSRGQIGGEIASSRFPRCIYAHSPRPSAPTAGVLQLYERCRVRFEQIDDGRLQQSEADR